MLRFKNTNAEDMYVNHDSKRYTIPAGSDFTINDTNPELVQAFKDAFNKEGSFVEHTQPKDEDLGIDTITDETSGDEVDEDGQPRSESGRFQKKK
jgi:hypothetical protein